MKFRTLSNREFIYLNKDNPSFESVINYLLTIGNNQSRKFWKKYRPKNIHKQFKKIPLLFKKKSVRKGNAIVPANTWNSYQEIVNTDMNKMNRSGYWGESLIRKELETRKYRIHTKCNIENQYGDLDIVAYKLGRRGKISLLEFHEVKTITRGASKQFLDLEIVSQLRHLLSLRQRKGGKKYVDTVLKEQVKLGNIHAKKLLNTMKYARVRYFLHKVVIDSKGREHKKMRQRIEWKRVWKQNIVWMYLKNIPKNIIARVRKV